MVFYNRFIPIFISFASTGRSLAVVARELWLLVLIRGVKVECIITITKGEI